MRTIAFISLLLLPALTFGQTAIPTAPGFGTHPPQVDIFDSLPGEPVELTGIAGDMWSLSRGPFFEYYLFYDDGAFRYSTGYSGGGFMVYHMDGEYSLITETNRLTLRYTKSGQPAGNMPGGAKIKKRDLPSVLEVVGLNDTLVVVRKHYRNHQTTVTYRRERGKTR